MNTPSDVTREEARAVSGPEAIAAMRLQVLAAARFKLCIYLPTLTSTVLSSPAELAELRRIAITGRGAEIRIVLGDPAAAMRAGHRLFDLAQRLPSVLRIRTPCDDEQSSETTASAWVLNDTAGYLFLPNADSWEGRAALRDGPGLAPLLLQFEQIWERAEPATLVQALGL